jgi:preprotein translocase subunit SecG
MAPYLNVVEIIISILLIVLILLQAKGSGLGAIFGQENAVFRTRRGAEKVIFQLTIVIAIVFCALSLVTVRIAGIPS